MPKSVNRVTLIASLVGLSLLFTSVVQAASIGTLKQFKTPTGNSFPRHITQGSDGNMWITQEQSSDGLDSLVARVTPQGDITEFVVCQFCQPNDIAQGPDGILYFTNNDVLLGRITTDGEVLPGVGPGLFVTGDRLAVHGDTVWVTDPVRHVLWRYDITANVFTSHAPTPDFSPGDVAVDANGVVWFIQGGDPLAIGSYDAAADVFTQTNIPAQAPGSNLRSLAVAADGSIWYTRPVDRRVGRLEPGVSHVENPVGLAQPAEIAAAPDGSVWFTQDSNMARMEITPLGIVLAETREIKDSLPLGIAMAANGDPWYVDNRGSKVVTLRLK